jgi:GT2 family glycosyltransferase
MIPGPPPSAIDFPSTSPASPTPNTERWQSLQPTVSRSQMTPETSVIVPTHNRLPYLRECLAALAAQTFPAERMEVVVVADGCTDGTEAALAEAAYPFEMRVLTQPGSGPSTARNRGADAARAPLLLFLDDDVVPSEALVAAHVGAHEGGEDTIAVGPYPLDPPRPGDFLMEVLHGYWVRKLDELASPDHRPDFRDVVSGNLSLSSSLFRRVGGFDPAFTRLEDYELGVRLFSIGVRYVYVPEAHARHLETTDLARSLDTTRRAGCAEVQMARAHPHVTPHLRLAKGDPIAALALRAPAAASGLARVGLGLLAVASRMRMRPLWRSIYGRLKLLAYWKGVAEEAGSPAAWEGLVREASARTTREPTTVRV